MRYVSLFTDVSCSDENFSDTPDAATIDISLDFIQKIKKMSEMVKENDFTYIANSTFDVKFLCYTDANDAEEYDGCYYYTGSNERFEYETLICTDNAFWFRSSIKYTSVEIATSPIDIENLFKIETLLMRIENNDFGCSISSLINDVVGDKDDKKYKERYVIMSDGETEYMIKINTDDINEMKRIYNRFKHVSILTVDNDNVIRIIPCDK